MIHAVLIGFSLEHNPDRKVLDLVRRFIGRPDSDSFFFTGVVSNTAILASGIGVLSTRFVA